MGTQISSLPVSCCWEKSWTRVWPTDNDLSVKDGVGNKPQEVSFRFMRHGWPGTARNVVGSLNSKPSAREDSSALSRKNTNSSPRLHQSDPFLMNFRGRRRKRRNWRIDQVEPAWHAAVHSSCCHACHAWAALGQSVESRRWTCLIQTHQVCFSYQAMAEAAMILLAKGSKHLLLGRLRSYLFVSFNIFKLFAGQEATWPVWGVVGFPFSAVPQQSC